LAAGGSEICTKVVARGAGTEMSVTWKVTLASPLAVRLADTTVAELYAASTMMLQFAPVPPHTDMAGA
jgi:hypothetical protein